MRLSALAISVLVFASSADARNHLFVGEMPCQDYFARLDYKGQTQDPEKPTLYAYGLGFAHARNISMFDDVDSFFLRSELICRKHGGRTIDVLLDASGLF